MKIEIIPDTIDVEQSMFEQAFWGVGGYLMWNGLWMLVMGVDKHQACQGKRRVSERTLFTGAFCLGALGVWAGMVYFRHKTKQVRFKVGIPVLLMINLVWLVFMVKGWR